FFCFQAEDGIRDRNVTGVQTCALPILIVILTFDKLSLNRYQGPYLLLIKRFLPHLGGLILFLKGQSTLLLVVVLIYNLLNVVLFLYVLYVASWDTPPSSL